MIKKRKQILIIIKLLFTGILDIFVIGSILSTQPILTSGIQSAHETWAHFWPLRVHFIAPPLLGHNTQSGLWLNEQVLHNQEPSGIEVMP